AAKGVSEFNVAAFREGADLVFTSVMAGFGDVYGLHNAARLFADAARALATLHERRGQTSSLLVWTNERTHAERAFDATLFDLLGAIKEVRQLTGTASTPAAPTSGDPAHVIASSTMQIVQLLRFDTYDLDELTSRIRLIFDSVKQVQQA